MTDNLLLRLKPRERQGSKPRCHLLTHGSPERVPVRLTRLIQPWGRVDITDHWMPQGFTNTTEAQLGRADNLVAPAVGKSLINWWLAVPRGARIPNWDITATCTVEGQPGLLLIEAKAHDEELNYEKAGKKRRPNETSGQIRNREQIHCCMQQSSAGFTNSTRMKWALSIEHHYQMSNRFAWAWKLTELGMPVILIYLGFLNAIEMSNRGAPLHNHRFWEELVLAHSAPLFPNQIWNRLWTLHGRPFTPLIKSMELPLAVEALEIFDDH